MPHINRVRLVNVNFNDAKGIYDDFMMTLNGKSTTYDLMNTGGKSLLLLMMLQTVIPNTYLKKEKPIKNIFIGGNTKRTSHCLIEWILDEGYEYQYMLTGFCARKKQELDEVEQEGEDKLEIDYYNYCYFYNKDNNPNIKTLPLVQRENNEKVYMSYDKLRQLLNNLKREGKPVEIFDSKKDYTNYIEHYGLIGAEWKLISEINVSENYIEKYFKENKTSRKLIENFLIKIIDNVNEQTKDGKEAENQLAETLIKLKENLMEFRKKSDNKNEYLQTKELYQNLKGQNHNLQSEFMQVDNLYQKAYEAYLVKKDEVETLNMKIQDEKTKIEELIAQNKEVEVQNSKLKIDRLYYDLKQVEEERDKLEQEKEKAEKALELANSQLELGKAQNEYIEYEQENAEANKLQIQIDNLSVGESDIQRDYQQYGYNYKIQLEGVLEKLKKQLEEQKEMCTQKADARNIAKKKENETREELTKCKVQIENLETQIKENQLKTEEIDKDFTEKGKMQLLLNTKESLDLEQENLTRLQNKREENTVNIEEMKEAITKNEEAIIQAKAHRTILESSLEKAQEEIKEYETKKKSIQSLAKAFGNSETPEKLKEKLEEELKEKEKQRNSKQIKQQIKQRKLELMEKYHMVVPNEEIIHLKEELEPKCTYVATGIEKLIEMSEEKRAETLRKNPLFIYSVFVDEASFLKMKNKQFEMEIENLVPIASIEVLRSGQEYSLSEMIFPVQKKVYESLNSENLEEYKIELNKMIAKLEQDIQSIKQKENEIRSYLEQTNYFITTYTTQKVEELMKEKDKVEGNLANIENEIKQKNREIQNDKEEIQNLQQEIIELEEQEKETKQEIELLEELIKTKQEIEQIREKKNKIIEEEKALSEILEEKIDMVDTLEYEYNNLKDKIRDIDNQKQNYSQIYQSLPEFKKMELFEESFEEIKNHFEALNERVNSSHSELSNLQKMQQLHKSAMEKCEKVIKENHYTLEYFKTSTEHFEKLLDSQIEERITKKQVAKHQCEQIEKECQQKDKEHESIGGKIEVLLEDLTSKGQDYQENERIVQLEIIEKMLKDNSAILKINKKEISNLNDKIQEVDKKIKEAEKEYNNLENFVEDKQIEPVKIYIATVLKSEVYSYQKIRAESNKLSVNINKFQSEFANYMNHIKESVENFYIKQDIFDILQEIKIPTKLEECNQIENGIAIIIEQLEEKIRHIEDALRSLEGYQQNFITKCSERAETIVRDLEKLPGLSKIKIGGKDINIIKLDLCEYEQEEKKKKMEEYIYQIVEEMEQRPEEMSKEQLNERLSSKALVAQAINMDKASVRLYKIEDIQEHSTYKKWEDDLGSDGQVNAIYFMFAVCIISYISMLTRREASSKTKKVIIVDNPFGATSAVFLWNVMFSILKENNVQLIAPGHNINKEIISKFEVNYVLKHEYYSDNRKSVVVEKELRTEDELDNLNFETIEGTQQSMF